MIDQYGLSHYSVVTPQRVNLEIMSPETGFLKFWNWIFSGDRIAVERN
jgi:hypothetical protein